MTIVCARMTKISLGLTVEFYVALVHLISTTTKSSFFFDGMPTRRISTQFFAHSILCSSVGEQETLFH
jgi:hypothetical protein